MFKQRDLPDLPAVIGDFKPNHHIDRGAQELVDIRAGEFSACFGFLDQEHELF